jgi:Zn-dependent M28 family amino/carboxypeptidase
MKPIRMFGLAALAAVAAMALIGIGSASAESTAFCKVHEEPCAAVKPPDHGFMLKRLSVGSNRRRHIRQSTAPADHAFVHGLW